MCNVFGLSKDYLDIIEKRFEEKRKLSVSREKELFSVFNEDLTLEEEWALKYLYAYMSLNDLADYSGEFFLNHIRTILNAREKITWGKNIPGDIFLHFVLPVRVNNENLENYSEVIFKELYNRVNKLSMYEAALEANHWCHEKVTYISTNIRTASPLTVMRSTMGRCGEESTLTVSTLRSICIPARQCYAPRWSHCDDNHAWVEVWVDGKWHYLGACEPEPKLDKGWFSGPAARAMLVNTRVPGNYHGVENVTLERKWYTELNLLKNYAKTRKMTVRVMDDNDHAIEGALVQFNVYNMAEFFPITSLLTDSNGEVSLITGYGDLMLYVSSSNGWTYRKVSVSDGDNIKIIINGKERKENIVELDIVPPPEVDMSVNNITDEEKDNNNMRLQEEDKIRASYESTFVSQSEAENLSRELSLPSDRVWNVLKKAKGNSHEIAKFLKEKTSEYGNWPLKLLESLEDKDLVDTFCLTLDEHLIYSLKYKDQYDEDIFIKYVMCPRVRQEMIRDYRKFFIEQFTNEEIEAFRSNPEKLVQWINANIDIVEGYTYYSGYASPKGSFELRKADEQSRDILFVAMARSFGIPARLEVSDKRPQHLKNSVWIDAGFTKKVKNDGKCIKMGKVRLVKDCSCGEEVVYYGNFTIARFEDGIFKTLDYEEVDFSYFEKGFELPEGYYRLTTGTRLTTGAVLTRLTFFDVKENESLDVKLIFRKENMKLNVLGRIPEGFSIKSIDGEKENVYDKIKDKGAVIAWIEPDREPTKHVLRELKELSQQFNNWGGRIYLCIGSDKVSSSFKMDSYKGLPDNVVFSIDDAYECMNLFTSQLNNEKSNEFPAVYALNYNGDIVYSSYGYKVGRGNDLLSIMKNL